MTTFWRLVLACIPALLVSCGQKEEAPAIPANAVMPPASPRAPHATTTTPAAPTVIPESGDPNAAAQQLTQALRDYVVRTRSVPKTFDEFATKANVTFPPPPPGKKYAIQAQAVVLVKQ